jgi:hypothetical protein
LEIIDYQRIRDTSVKGGRENRIRSRAKELQIQLSEPGSDIPFVDAYEMAYNEIISESREY